MAQFTFGTVEITLADQYKRKHSKAYNKAMFAGVSLGIDAAAIQSAEDLDQSFELPLVNQDVAMEALIVSLVTAITADGKRVNDIQDALDGLDVAEYMQLKEHAETVKSTYEKSAEEQKKS